MENIGKDFYFGSMAVTVLVESALKLIRDIISTLTPYDSVVHEKEHKCNMDQWNQ